MGTDGREPCRGRRGIRTERGVSPPFSLFPLLCNFAGRAGVRTWDAVSRVLSRSLLSIVRVDISFPLERFERITSSSGRFDISTGTVGIPWKAKTVRFARAKPRMYRSKATSAYIPSSYAAVSAA